LFQLSVATNVSDDFEVGFGSEALELIQLQLIGQGLRAV
jgi:hypothetical protein